MLLTKCFWPRKKTRITGNRARVETAMRMGVGLVSALDEEGKVPLDLRAEALMNPTPC